MIRYKIKSRYLRERGERVEAFDPARLRDRLIEVRKHDRLANIVKIVPR